LVSDDLYSYIENKETRIDRTKPDQIICLANPSTRSGSLLRKLVAGGYKNITVLTRNAAKQAEIQVRTGIFRGLFP
jgi:hypothetical protein